MLRLTALVAKGLLITKKRRKKHNPKEIVTNPSDTDAMLHAGKKLVVVLQTSEATVTRRQK